MKNEIASSFEAKDHLSSLIARTARGDDSAFSELYALTHRKMRKTIGHVNVRGAEAEDILQDSFLKIWKNASNYDSKRSSPISWMSVIVRNTSIDAVRLRSLPTVDLDEALFVAEPTQDTSSDFDYVGARQIAAAIISRLPDDRRELLSRAYIEGESRESLAKRFGAPVNTVKTWLRRTLEIVRADCTAHVRRQAANPL